MFASLSCDFAVATFVAALMRKPAIRGDVRQIASTAEESANSRSFCTLWRFLSEVVAATGFEPTFAGATAGRPVTLRVTAAMLWWDRAPPMTMMITQLNSLPVTGSSPSTAIDLTRSPRLEGATTPIRSQLDSRSAIGGPRRAQWVRKCECFGSKWATSATTRASGAASGKLE